MKHFNPFYYALWCMGLLLINSCAETRKDKSEADAVDAALTESVEPEIVFENSYVQMVKVHLDPGQRLVSHQGAPRAIYSLADYSLQWEENGQDLGRKSWQKGEVHFHESGIHSAKNIGDQAAVWVAFVHKGNKLPDCPEDLLDKDVNAVSPDYATLMFENDLMRITRVDLPTGASIPRHSGINRLIYSLTDYSLKYEDENEEVGIWDFGQDTVHWHEACEHSVENAGEDLVSYLVVAFKDKKEKR